MSDGATQRPSPIESFLTALLSLKGGGSIGRRRGRAHAQRRGKLLATAANSRDMNAYLDSLPAPAAPKVGCRSRRADTTSPA